tara:strand:- start:680 stop:1702 length:1023 start_codon:yes stop_codon:yes gene_type:complete
MLDTTTSKINKVENIKKTVLVTGAGYIGANIAGCLQKNGYTPVVVSRDISQVENFVNDAYKIDLPKDMHLLDEIVKRYSMDTVIHTASSKNISESIKDPSKYYKNNVVMTIQLLNKCVELGINKFIFSSSSSVYGQQTGSCVETIESLSPFNPYGSTKLMCETIIKDYSRAFNINALSFRIFNVAGLCDDCNIGDSSKNVEHLIPKVIKAGFQVDKFIINGNDYDTPDGTCIRDYIHVKDVADAHVQAIKLLGTKITCDTLNLGTGIGISNQSIVERISKHTGAIDVEVGVRKLGDPEVLIADMDKTKNKLNWKPKYSGIDNIIQSAVQWYKTCNKKEIN